MTTHAISPVSFVRGFLRALVGIAGIGGIALAALPASGQVVIGGNASPNVVIDYSVLDELGRAPNVPQLLSGRSPNAPLYPFEYRTQPRFPIVSGDGGVTGSDRIVLKPPGTKTRRTARRKTLSKPSSGTSTKKPAAKAPVKPRAKAERRKTQRPKAPAGNRPQPLTPPPPPEMTKAPSGIAPPPPPPAAPPVAKRTVEEDKVAALPPPVAPPPAPKISAPPAAAKRTTSKPPSQTASVPRDTAPVRPGTLRRIAFSAGSAKLNASATKEIKTVGAAMQRDSALRIQLLAYAGQASDSASQARRLSLSRALAARSQLIELGVRSTRIDVRALGNKSAGGPADRIDIIVTKR